jgi:transposase
MATKIKKYTKEFREEAVKLALKSTTVSQAAISLGIPPGTLYSWVEKTKSCQIANDKSSAGAPNAAEIDIADLIEENRRLYRENSVLKEEKEILKKAAQYFAQHQK